MSIAAILKDISAVVFPQQCPGCSEFPDSSEKTIFCAKCEEKIHFIQGAVCPVCGINFPDSPAESHLCGDCSDQRPYFFSARAVFSFETVILEAIHRFKYKRDFFIGETLASYMAGFPFSDIDFSQYSLILPVPLHIKRLRERGFNQSLILARAIGKKHKIPVDFSLLKRHKFTETQTGMHKNERKLNIKGAFEVINKKKIAGQNIILADDVYTTGSTVNECSKVLLKAKADRVAVLTLARVLKK
jgi:ComF family protein